MAADVFTVKKKKKKRKIFVLKLKFDDIFLHYCVRNSLKPGV